MTDRTQRDFAESDIRLIADSYIKWKRGDQSYENIPGFCKSVSIEEIKSHNYALVPGRYVGFKKRFIEEFDIDVIKQEMNEIKERVLQMNQTAKKSLILLEELTHGHTILK